MNTKFPLTIALILSVGFSGCNGIIKSQHYSGRPEQPGAQTGPEAPKVSVPVLPADAGYYFLPKAKVKIIAKRGNPTIYVEQQPPAPQKPEQKPGPPKPSDPKKPEKKKTEKKKLAAAAGAGAGEEKREQPVNIVKPGENTPKPADDQCTIQLKEVVIEPDPEMLFRLNHVGAPFSDDDITVTLTPNGFLAAVNLKTTDQSGEFIVKLAELAKEVAKAAAVIAFGLYDKERKAPFYFTFFIDPTNETEVDKANKLLNDVGCNIEIGKPPKYEPPVIPAERNGIFYRAAMPYGLTFKTKTIDATHESMEVTNELLLPNKSPILVADLTREPFVKVINGLKFTNGMLTEVTINKPSSAIGAINIPIRVAQQILAIPGEIFKLKIDLTNQEANLLNAQKSTVEAQKDLLEEKEALRKLLEQIRSGQQNQGTTVGKPQ